MSSSSTHDNKSAVVTQVETPALDSTDRACIEAFLQCLKIALSRVSDPDIKSLRATFGIPGDLIPDLVRLDVLEPEGGGYMWVTEQCPAAVAESLITLSKLRDSNRRLLETNARLTTLEGKVTQLEASGAAHEELGMVNQEIARINDTLNAQATLLKNYDPESVELATLYASESQDKLNALTTAVGRIASIVLATSPAELQAMVSEFKIKNPEPPKAPKKERTKLRIGILGIFERDIRHVEDKLKASEAASQFNLKLEPFDHTTYGPQLPKNMDAVFVGDNAHKRYPETKQIYGDRCIRWVGGFGSCAQTIEQFLKTLR